MSYDMKKMDVDNWQKIMASSRYNRRKIMFHPFYNKSKFVKELYEMQMHQKLDLKHPKTFSEKLNAFKLDKYMLKHYSQYVDKNEVRKYVAKKIGSKYLIPQYFYKKKITPADLEKLPKQFVLKTTNGSGTNYIVLDKDKEDLAKVCWYLNWLSTIKYGYIWGEFLYNKIKPGIVAEQLLLDEDGNIPDDLKCFCFKDDQGIKRKILYIERVIGDERARIMFNEKWEPVEYGCSFEKLNITIKKPQNYKKILSIIDALSDDFNFVRVDLFLVKNKIYFGELTFIPTAGYLKFDRDGLDLEWGSYIATKPSEGDRK